MSTWSRSSEWRWWAVTWPTPRCSRAVRSLQSVRPPRTHPNTSIEGPEPYSGHTCAPSAASASGPARQERSNSRTLSQWTSANAISAASALTAVSSRTTLTSSLEMSPQRRGSKQRASADYLPSSLRDLATLRVSSRAFFRPFLLSCQTVLMTGAASFMTFSVTSMPVTTTVPVALATVSTPLLTTLLLGPYPHAGHTSALPICFPHLEHLAICYSSAGTSSRRRYISITRQAY